MKIDINVERHINSNIVNAKKLNILARRLKLKSPLYRTVNAVNNNTTNKIVCIPKGTANFLITKEIRAKDIPIGSIFFQLSGILAIIKAKVTIPISSGIPCKSNAINGILIFHTTSP